MVSQLLLPAKEDVQDIVFGHLPVFALHLEGQVLFERGSTLLSIGLRSNINQPGPEALYQINFKRWTSASPRSSGQELLPGAAALSVGQSDGTAPPLSLVPPIFVHAMTLAIAPGVLAIIIRPVMDSALDMRFLGQGIASLPDSLPGAPSNMSDGGSHSSFQGASPGS